MVYATSIIRKKLQKAFPSPNTDAIVLSRFGRSGSTMLYESLIAACAKRRFGLNSKLSRSFCRDEAWGIAGKPLYRGVVYKTHDLPIDLPKQPNSRAIFIFGSATEAALSVMSCKQRYGDQWINNHFSRLKSRRRIEDVPFFDVLQFEKQHSMGTNFSHIPVLCVKFEKIWQNLRVLEEFVGFHLELPERRDRKSSKDDRELVDTIMHTYSHLDEVIDGLPDFCLSGSI